MHAKKIILEILAYVLVSIMKNVKLMNNEYLSNCTCMEREFDKLVMTCEDERQIV